MTRRPRYLLPTGHAVPLAAREATRHAGASRLRCAGDELIDRRVSARAGPACAGRASKAEPGAAPGRGGAQRSRLDG
jgi:hypothetical protein